MYTMPQYSLLIFSSPGLFKQSNKSFSYHCFCQLTMVGNTYPQNICTFQSRHGIQKNSSCNTVEIKLLFGAHDVSLHKLFHKLIFSAQCFKEMPPGTLRMRLGQDIIFELYNDNNKQGMIMQKLCMRKTSVTQHGSLAPSCLKMLCFPAEKIIKVCFVGGVLNFERQKI